MLKSRRDNTIFYGKGSEMEQFTTRNCYVKSGVIVRIYQAFEGGTRYIFRTDNGEYRCIKDENGEYREYVA